MIKITCKGCGKTWLDLKSRLNRNDAKTVSFSRGCANRVREVTAEVRKKMSDSHGRPTWLDGKPPWNKGKKLHYEVWNKGKKLEYATGKNNHNWKGGITPILTKIRNSASYKVWRITVFKRDNYTCQNCGVRGTYLHADHIKPFALYPELRLDVSNGRTLSVPCHRQTPTFAGRTRWSVCV